jgi:hypothetical protein
VSRKKPTTTQYLQVTPEALRQAITPQQNRELREPGHMVQYFWWPMCMTLAFPLFFAVPLTGCLFLLWWIGSWLLSEISILPLMLMPWQIALCVFGLAYLWSVSKAADKYFPFVIKQWAGKGKLAKLQNTTIVRHERSEPHLVQNNPRGSRPSSALASLGQKMADVYERITAKTEDTGFDIPPERKREYDTLMAIWPYHDHMTRDIFNEAMTGGQGKYARYIPCWEKAGVIERLSEKGGFRFVMNLPDVLHALGMLPHSGDNQTENGRRGTNQTENERTNERGKHDAG